MSSDEDLLQPEMVVDIRNLIRKQVQNLRVDEHISGLLKQAKVEGRDVMAEEALERIRALGVIDNVVSSISATLAKKNEGAPDSQSLPALQAGPPPSASELRKAAARSQDHRYLFLRVKGGFGFTQYIVDPPKPGETMMVCGSLLGQRFVSKPVPASLEPRFDVGALIKLPVTGAADVHKILSEASEAKMHLAVVRVASRPGELTGASAATKILSEGDYDPIWGPMSPSPGSGPSAAAVRVGRKNLIGSAWVDWRKALVSGVGRQLSTTVEILSPLGGGGIGAGPLVPAGTLELKLEVLPGPDAALDPSELKTIQRTEATGDAHKGTALMARTRSWYTEASTTYPVVRERNVLLVAYGEDGVQRPVTAFVRPILPPRSLPTVRKAARFVSLLQSADESRVLGPLGAHCVSSPQSTVAGGRGTSLDRALLLCSLFKGFHLNAWVCVGSDPRGPHFWVVTIDHSAGGAFWEPLTGRRYPLADVVRPGGSPYITLDSIFNHERVLVNVQRDNVLLTCQLDFDDARAWREFRAASEESPCAMAADGGAYPRPALRDSSAALTGSLPALEARLEAELRFLVKNFRASELNLVVKGTEWDAVLEPLLMPALEGYESEAVHGVPHPGSEEFTESIKAAVPTGYTFQGFPSHHVTLDSRAIFDAIISQVPAMTLLQAEGNRASFALRVKITPYAEDVLSVWVMLASKVAPATPVNKVVYRGGAR